MRYLFSFCVSLVLSFISINTYAAEHNIPNIEAVKAQALTKNLYNHPYWLKLLHYNADFKSEIITPNFFLSKTGSTNPKDELLATITSFYQKKPEDQNNHSQCKFIARYKWLRKNLDFSLNEPPSIYCENFNKWSMNEKIKSLSLIFATGYLENPASFYGHILLKFNSSDTHLNYNLLDLSINYGAIVPDNEHPIAYIAKGLFGGYDAAFSHNQFYRHNHIYIENELRDMWEYELSLTSDEVDQIIAHGWELMGNNYVYYFLNQNCAYRMGELLELVVDQPLFSRSIPWTMPSSIFENIITTEHNNQPLVKSVTQIPSRQKMFYMKHSNLKGSQRKISGLLINNNYSFQEPEYKELPADEKIEIIDTLIDYNEYLFITNKLNNDTSTTRYKLLIERSLLPRAETAQQQNSEIDLPPHLGPLPAMFRISTLHNNILDTGLLLQFRPAYFDILSLDEGRLPNSNLTMFDLKATLLNDKLEIRSLDIVNIETFNISQTNLPGDGGFAWKIKFGFENQNLACTDCTIFNFIGSLGQTSNITNKTLLFFMIDGFAQTEYNNSGTLGGKIRTGVISSLHKNWKTQITASYQEYFNGTEANTYLTSWENRFGNNRHWDVRVNFHDNVAKEIEIGASFYW